MKYSIDFRGGRLCYDYLLEANSNFIFGTLVSRDKDQNSGSQNCLLQRRMVLKRRLSSHVVCIDPKKTKGIPIKNQTKAELVKDIKAIEKINETLEEENKCLKNEK